MKYAKYFIAASLAALFFAACQEKVSDPKFAEDEIPYIYMEWAGNAVYNVGDTIKFNPQVAPLEGTSVRWLIDDEVICNECQISYVITQTEPFVLRFEAERNGKINFRTSNVTIVVPFVPKDKPKNVIGVLTSSGVSSQIQWDYITHLQITPFIVQNSDGSLTMPDASFMNSLKTIVSMAHNNGVYVIADITSPINMYMGTGFYNNNGFGSVAKDENASKALAGNIRALVDEYDLDGVNIYINELNNDWGGLSDKEAMLALVNRIAVSLPTNEQCERGKFYFTASIPMAWNYYDMYFLVGCKRIDWYNFMMFGATDLAPCHHAADWNINEKVGGFYNQGISLDQIVVAIPCTGVKYDIPAGTTVTWGNQESFLSFYPYNQIVAGMPTDNLFYVTLTGDNSVESKVSIALNNWGASGIMVWAEDYDTTDPETSITQAVNNCLYK